MAISKQELDNIKKICRKLSTIEIVKDDEDNFIIWDTFRNEMSKYITARFADGGFAGVFIPRNKNYVIKVIEAGSNDRYSKYARFCWKNHDKFSNVPKIHSVFKSKNYEFFIIEKLYHNFTVSNRFQTAYDLHVSGHLKSHHKFYPLFTKLDKMFGEGCCDDIGGYNVMVRKNGTAVLTDPITD
jgi:hypothetical protein